MLGSKGQVGSAGDNAAMESFFSLLQKNVLNRQTWGIRDQLCIAIVTWIERTYHRRRQAALGRLTPIEYELIMSQIAGQAPELSQDRAADPWRSVAGDQASPSGLSSAGRIGLPFMRCSPRRE
jgi:hypothetical protein